MGQDTLPVFNNVVPEITKVEYFFDDDPGFGNAHSVPISPGDSIVGLNISLGLDTLTEGIPSFFHPHPR